MKVKKIKCFTEKDARLLYKIYSNLMNPDFVERIHRQGRIVSIYYFTDAKK